MVQSLTARRSHSLRSIALGFTSAAALLIVVLQIAGLRISPVNGGLVYLLLTILIAVTYGARAGVLCAIAANIVMNFFYLDPIFGFAMSELQHILAIPVFFIGAAVGASLRQPEGKDELQIESPAGHANAASLQLDIEKEAVFVDGREVRLTPTEFKLLRFFVANSDRVLRPALILDNVWGEGYTQDVRVLRTYVNQLRRKLGDDPMSPRFIRTDPGFGYRFLGSS